MGTGQTSGSESGQALIEYLLIVIVSVTLVVSLAMAVFQPLGNFVNDLNRKYVQCLLETGELPQLSSQEENVICFDEFPTFAALDENGNPISPGADSAGQLEKKDALATTDGQTSNVGGAGAGSSGSGYAGSSSRGRRGRAGTESRANKVVTIPVSQEFDEGSGFMSSSQGGGGYRIRKKKQRQIAITGLMDADRREIEKKIERSQTRAVSSDEGFTTPRKKKVAVKPPPPKMVESDIKVEMGFGKYFKIFFLIIFVLFVVIIFGSQAMQISKNWSGS